MKSTTLLSASCFAMLVVLSAQAQDTTQILQVSPSDVSQTKIRASSDASLKIGDLEEKKLANSPAVTVDDIVRPATSAQQDDIDQMFAELLAALAGISPCPDPDPAPNFELAYGYDNRLSPRNNDQGPRTQKGPLSFSYFPNNRFVFGVGLDTFSSRKVPDMDRVTGVGNASLNFSYKVAPEGASPIPLTLDYALTIPSASVSKGLGRGRFDHLITGTIPRSFGSRETCSQNKVNRLTFTLGALVAGRAKADGYSSIGLLIVGYDRYFGIFNKHRFHFEVDGSSRSGTFNADSFALGYFQFKTSKNTSLRIGSRAGLIPNATRFGFFVRFAVTGKLGEIFKIN